MSCWGTGELKRFDVAEPARRRARPARCGSAASSSAAAHPRRRPAQRRPADGRDRAATAARLPHQLALRGVGRAVLPRGHRRLARQARRRRGRLADRRPGRVRPSSAASGRTRCGCRAATRRRTPTASRTSCMDALAAADASLRSGAYHGLNPAMGWLFAVALGMQERDRARRPAGAAADRDRARAVDRARGRRRARARADRRHVGAAHGRRHRAVAFGIFRFVKPRAHPRWTTMRVNRRELAWWSFLMSSAHGAGLMVAPVLIGAGARPARRRTDHAIEAAGGSGAAFLDERVRARAARGGDGRGDGLRGDARLRPAGASRSCARRGSTSTACGRAPSCWPACLRSSRDRLLSARRAPR